MQATDEELVRQLQAGDQESLGVLVARWERPLFRYVYRLCQRPEDARDVCQETFLRILRKAHRFREGSRFSTWMYQIALNLCRDRARHRSRWRRILARAPASDGPEATAVGVGCDVPTPEQTAEKSELIGAVRQALGEIPSEQREVLVMKEFEGLKFREIAAILGCPESTVKSRMYYGLRSVREHLRRHGVD